MPVYTHNIPYRFSLLQRLIFCIWKYFRMSHKFLHAVLLTLLLIKEKKMFVQENAISNNVQIMYK